jgi:hypothetical protein
MRPAQRVKQAEEAASKLSSLVHSSRVTQLLQQPLPAQPTAAQQAVLASCSKSVQQLLTFLPQHTDSSLRIAVLLQLLRGVLRHQAVHSAGLLLAWLQQQPQQLAAALLGCNPRLEATVIMQSLWLTALNLVLSITVLVVNCAAEDSSSTAPLAFNLTQQLQQTGVYICPQHSNTPNM